MLKEASFMLKESGRNQWRSSKKKIESCFEGVTRILPGLNTLSKTKKLYNQVEEIKRTNFEQIELIKTKKFLKVQNSTNRTHPGDKKWIRNNKFKMVIVVALLVIFGGI